MITVQLWKRKGRYYYAYIHVQNRGSYGTITKKLSFIAYHLIRIVHGEQKLMDMASEYTPMGDQ
jgi:hypothetical protein